MGNVTHVPKAVATLLDGAGESARVAADQLGHSRISMTRDVYMGRRAVGDATAQVLGALGDLRRP